MDSLKTTPFTEIHKMLGAKMVPFAGYLMPVQYGGLIEEHLAVRKRAGMFDVSHMGEFFVEGPDALALLQKTTSNDVSKLSPGKVQYSCLPNYTGGIVDDLLVYNLAKDSYMLVVNASNMEKDFDWLQQNAQGLDVQLKNLSNDFALLAVQGPEVASLLQPLTKANLLEIPYYHFEIAEFAGIPNVIISATGYTGAGGFELYVKNESAEPLWHAISNLQIPPAGLGARDTLRLEKAFCLYGNDINDETSPLEAGLGWITKFNKDFINSEALKNQKDSGLNKKLVGFEMIDRGIPRQHYLILDKEGQKIGEVTSGTQSPSLNKAIGLGYVEINHSAIGSEIFVEIRNKAVKAMVVKTPFL